MALILKVPKFTKIIFNTGIKNKYKNHSNTINAIPTDLDNEQELGFWVNIKPSLKFGLLYLLIVLLCIMFDSVKNELHILSPLFLCSFKL